MNPLKVLVNTISGAEVDTSVKANASIYNIEINNLQGQPVDLNDYRGKYILFVNVASKCGFTPQYKELQELQDMYPNELAIIGVPCNQFGAQEPGSPEDIQKFCEVNYGVKFLITEKIDVKGFNQHPLYAWLTNKDLNGKLNTSVKWNFQKYLVSEKGELIDFYFSITKPTNSRITKHIK
ncbi:MAG: glutathione peroxidase [Winogradskyella sp.]|uniref:glutathione peroxidase n=1 Tax=Winogradskyella sp. TaxID=1883156 RepID=UPI000F3CEAE6|nr:glutathione peroxidase [Winogradskyella sp.]RNC86489.1 MAG: glutathione peroxidase [Winogradskyella sp.]